PWRPCRTGTEGGGASRAEVADCARAVKTVAEPPPPLRGPPPPEGEGIRNFSARSPPPSLGEGDRAAVEGAAAVEANPGLPQRTVGLNPARAFLIPSSREQPPPCRCSPPPCPA